MKITIKLIITLFLFVGCSSNEENINQNLYQLSSINSTVSARLFIENDEQLDFSNMDFNNPYLLNSLSDIDIAKFKAAVYRFYKNVQIVNGRYITKLQSGAEIKISENYFTALKTNLEELNKQIDENNIIQNKSSNKDKALKAVKISEDYLNYLLK